MFKCIPCCLLYGPTLDWYMKLLTWTIWEGTSERRGHSAESWKRKTENKNKVKSTNITVRYSNFQVPELIKQTLHSVHKPILVILWHSKSNNVHNKFHPMVWCPFVFGHYQIGDTMCFCIILKLIFNSFGAGMKRKWHKLEMKANLTI